MRIIIEMEGTESQNVRVSQPGASEIRGVESSDTTASTRSTEARLDDPANVEAFDGGTAPAIDMLGGPLDMDMDENVRVTQTGESIDMSSVVDAGAAPDPAEAVMLDEEDADEAFIPKEMPRQSPARPPWSCWRRPRAPISPPAAPG